MSLSPCLAWISRPLLMTIIISSSVSGIPLGFAQTPSLEEVVVTAQRRETLLQDTPIAITPFDTERLQALGVRNIADLGGLAPNTNIQKQPSSNLNMSIYIRGVGDGETSLMVDPKTSFYLDGVYISKTTGAVFDIVELAAVEVLRGPQGTLFGRNSTGGALNVTTTKPSGEFSLRAESQWGNQGYQRNTLSLDSPTVFDKLSASVTGMVSEYDGWASNHYPGVARHLGSEHNKAWRLALHLDVTESLVLDYSYDQTNNQGVPTPFQITAVKDSLFNGFSTTPAPFTLLGGSLYQQMQQNIGDPHRRQEDFLLDGVTEEWLDVRGQNFTVNWDTGPLTLKYILGQRKTDSGYQLGEDYLGTDLDGGAYTARDLFYGGDMSIPVPGFHSTIDDSQVSMLTHELQIIGEALDHRLRYTVGAYHYKEKIYQSNPQTISLPIQFLLGAGLDPLYEATGFCNRPDGSNLFCQGSQRLPLPFPSPGADPNMNGLVDFIYGQTTASWALYGQATHQMNDTLDITLGLRYTEDERRAFMFNESTGQINFEERFRNSGHWNNLSYLLTLSYRPAADLQIYATHSTAFNSGGFNSRASTRSSWDQPYDEETVSSYEMGLKSDWLGRRLRLNAALFYNDYTDIQVTQFEAGSGGASSRIVNAGEADYRGVEIELQALLGEHWRLEASYGYLHAEFDEYLALNPATDRKQDIADVTSITRAPRHNGSLGLVYDLALMPVGTLSARMDVLYSDSFTFHPFQNQYDSAGSRTLLNARLQWAEIPLGENGQLLVAGWGKNLTDEEYREWGIDFSSLGFAGNTFGRPRTYGIDFVYRYH